MWRQHFIKGCYKSVFAELILWHLLRICLRKVWWISEQQCWLQSESCPRCCSCNTSAAYLAGTHDRLTMIESYIESECNTLSNSFCNTDVKAHQDSDFQLSAPGLYLAPQPDRLATSLPGNKMVQNSSITPQKIKQCKNSTISQIAQNDLPVY